MSFIYLSLFKPKERTEDYYNRGPNDKKITNEIDDKKIIIWKKNLLVLKRLIASWNIV